MRIGLVVFSVVLFFQCSTNIASQARLVGGPCEGCEAVLEYNRQGLSAVDTLPGFEQAGPSIKVSGTIYQSDGFTPAPETILYLYHTNQVGIYAPAQGAEGWAKRHGKLRGWVKTDQQGKYTFYTTKAGNYPGGKFPAHIHPTLLEPNGKYYYVEDYYFHDDPTLTSKERAPKAPRGGTAGVLLLKKVNGLWIGKRDFILGKNIPNYE